MVSLIALTLVVVAELMIPRLIQRIIDEGIAKGDMKTVITSSLIMVGLALSMMALFFVNTFYSVQVSENFVADLRSVAFRQIQKFSFNNLDKLQSGEILVRMTSDLNIVKMAVLMLMRMFFRAPLMLVGSLIMLIITSPRLALMLVILLPLTAILIVYFSKKARSMFKLVQQKLDRVNTIFQENIAGVRVVKAFVRDEYENKRFDSANEEYMQRGIQVHQMLAILLPSMIILINLGVTAIIWVGGLMTINGQMTTGEIVAFANYLATSMFPIVMLGMILPQLYAAAASTDRVFEIINTEPTIIDVDNAARLDGKSHAGRVEFKNVSFYYNGNHDKADAVLKNISFTAEPGERVAILGATGSGKSTLINLIPRFYDVSEGQVLINGIDVRQISQEDLRRQVGVALQESILFSGTVAENIAYGQPDLPDEKIVNAAKAAQAHEFILTKPDGYNENVSQKGMNFSGGQKQRIAIARALSTDPMILILDDSTSSVDVETEIKIQDAMEKLMQGKTSFIVAQRISTVLNADKIIVLENGEIAAIGNHESLMKSSEIYQDIYHSQLGNNSHKNFHQSINTEASHA